MARFRVIPALALAVSIFVPSRAFACWDGFYARVESVDVMGYETQWDEPTLRHHATWLGRINTLLPAGATVTSEHGFLTVNVGGTSTELTWSDGDYRTLFNNVARSVGAPPIAIQRALRLDTPVYVVQAGAFVNETRAYAQADAISQGTIAVHGFYEVGGFPAINPTAHVVTIHAKRTIHRVYVGAFVNRQEAEAIAKRLGQSAFVRELNEQI